MLHKPAYVRSYSRHVRVRLNEGSFQYNCWVRYWSRILLGRVFGLLIVLSFERTIEIRIQDTAKFSKLYATLGTPLRIFLAASLTEIEICEPNFKT